MKFVCAFRGNTTAITRHNDKSFKKKLYATNIAQRVRTSVDCNRNVFFELSAGTGFPKTRPTTVFELSEKLDVSARINPVKTLPPLGFSKTSTSLVAATNNCCPNLSSNFEFDQDYGILLRTASNLSQLQQHKFQTTTTASSTTAVAATTTATITTMPSKQTNDVLAVEELVHEIKENLRLKARPSHNHGRNSRPSPYHIPCRSWSDQATTGPDKAKKASNNTDIDDPYELLQALLKSNNLVKEAVRRLQLNISPKQRCNFYDSDEESRSPLFRVCQLEL